MMTYTAFLPHFGSALTLSLMGETGDPNDPRLRFALRIFRKIERGVDRETARAWMTTTNGGLGGRTPIEAIRDNDFDPVMEVALAFMETAAEL